MGNSLPKLPSLPKMKSVNACECGCGGRTGNRFVPGHDAKLLGLTKRVAVGVMTLDEVAAWGCEGQAVATAKALKVSRSWVLVTEEDEALKEA